jgi:gliding motility-associated-like protein
VDNVPTPLVIGTHTVSNVAVSTETLFIPEGFSPDGDGVNDQWRIKGLPSDANSELTIFNRWGNKVYYHGNYYNAIPWDGTPNVAGTVGGYKLPQGTYYYILDIKGYGKPKTGFVVLQYDK